MPQELHFASCLWRKIGREAAEGPRAGWLVEGMDDLDDFEEEAVANEEIAD